MFVVEFIRDFPWLENLTPHLAGFFTKKLVQPCWEDEFFFSLISSGEIIATSHDLTPNGGLVREIPLFQGNLGW